MNERDRILHVMQSEGLNAKQFCQEVGISPSTLSNITGGRNKPSLDVMQAILRRFRAINCDWLVMGVGTMYINGSREEGMLGLFDDENDLKDATKPITSATQYDVRQDVEKKSRQNESLVPLARTVSKILIFYSDGTFEER